MSVSEENCSSLRAVPMAEMEEEVAMSSFKWMMA